MPDKIRPSEVSEVLLQQLKGINTSIQFDEVGAVLQVSDGVARIYGLLHAEANELLEFENGVMGVVMNLEEDNVGAVLLGATDLIKDDCETYGTHRLHTGQREHAGARHRPVGRSFGRKRHRRRGTFRNAAGTQSSRSHLPPTGI